MEQTDGNRFNALVQHILHGAVHIGFIQGPQHLAFEVQPFADFQTELPLDQGWGLLILEVIEPGDAVAPELQDVPEPLGGDQGGLGPLLLNDGVGGHGEPVANLRHHAGGDPQFPDSALDAFQDRPAVIVGSAGDLAGQHLSVVAQENDVGECAADIYANAEFLHTVTRNLLVIGHDTVAGKWWQGRRCFLDESGPGIRSPDRYGPEQPVIRRPRNRTWGCSTSRCCRRTRSKPSR